MKLICAASLISTVLTCFAHGQSRRMIYVDHRAGDDRAGGTSPVKGLKAAGPMETIQAGLRRALPGGNLILLPAGHPHREEVTMDGRMIRGYPWRPFIIEGNHQEWAGDATTKSLAPIHYGVDIRWLQVPLTLAERLICGSPYGSVVVSLTPPTFPISATNGFLSCGVNSTAGISSNAGVYQGIGWNPNAAVHHPLAFDRSLRIDVLAKHRLRHALVLDRAEHVTVRNVRFRGFSLDAVQVRGPVRGIVFENCSFINCGRAGLSATTNAEVQFRNCAFEGNGQAGALALNYSHLKARDCLFKDSPAPISTDPTSRVELSAGQFRPISASPVFVPPEFQERHPELLNQPPASSTERDKPVKEEKASEVKPADSEKKPKKSFFDD